MKLVNVVVALMAASVNMLDCTATHSESEDGDQGPTAVSTWDMLPAFDPAPNIIMPDAVSHTVMPMATVLQHTDVWLAAVRDANFSMPLQTSSFENAFGWERTLFNSVNIDPMPYSRQVRMPMLHPVVNTPVIEPVAPSIDHERAWHGVARRMRNLNPPHTAEASRSYAINRWKLLIQHSPKHSEVGRILQQQIWDLFDDQQLIQTLEDIFSTKSTATLLKRGNDMTKYFLWTCKKKIPFLPISEQSVYLYLYDSQLKSATGPSAFKEALNFSGALVGFEGAATAAGSARVIGYCKKRYLLKAPLRQARVLSVEQVIHLENMVMDEMSEFDLNDRVMAGHSLYAMYARARWTDSLFPSQWELDEDPEGGGYYQADTLISKTSTTAEKKTRFLPLTGPLKGITTAEWFQTWRKLRELTHLPEPNGKTPLIRALRLDGTFSASKLSTSDASAWIRDLLKLGGFKNDQRDQVSSHSLKATPLSWCAKYGLDLHTRQVLGYHASAANASAAHYSRDELAAPLRAFEEVLESIRAGRFKPDQTRSGYLSPSPKSAVRPDALQRIPGERGSVEEVPDSSSGSSSDSDSDSSSSGEDSGMETLALEVDKHRPNESAGNKKRRLDAVISNLYLHTRWKTLHCEHEQYDFKLKCGRMVTTLYKTIRIMPTFQYHKCLDCFRQSEPEFLEE